MNTPDSAGPTLAFQRIHLRDEGDGTVLIFEVDEQGAPTGEYGHFSKAKLEDAILAFYRAQL